MTAQSTVCPVCGEEAPFGRRTCEACGANLAAVPATEGGDATDEAMTEPTGLLVSEDAPLAASEAFEPALTVALEPPAAVPVDVPPLAEAPATTTAVVADFGPATPVAAEPSAATPPAVAPPVAAGSPVVSESAAPAPAVVVQPPVPAAHTPPAPAAPSRDFMPPVLKEWTAVPPAVAVELAAAEAEPDPSAVAGAWLPPSAVHRVGTSAAPGPRVAAAIPAGRPWLPTAAGPAPPATAATPFVAPPAATQAVNSGSDGSPMLPPSLAEMLNRSSAGTARWPDDAVTPPSPGMTVTASAAARPPEGRPSSESPPAARGEGLVPGRAPLFADLPFDAPDSLAGWLVAAGGAVAAVAFFLPWSPLVLGAGGFGSYFDEWGFATAAYWPVFLLVAITAALSILENRVASWLRHGFLGLVTGGLLLGIVWPYLVGGFGSRIGVLAEAVACALLIVGGLVAVAPPRSDREAR